MKAPVSTGHPGAGTGVSAEECVLLAGSITKPKTSYQSPDGQGCSPNARHMRDTAVCDRPASRAMVRAPVLGCFGHALQRKRAAIPS